MLPCPTDFTSCSAVHNKTGKVSRGRPFAFIYLKKGQKLYSPMNTALLICPLQRNHRSTVNVQITDRGHAQIINPIIFALILYHLYSLLSISGSIICLLYTNIAHYFIYRNFYFLTIFSLLTIRISFFFIFRSSSGTIVMSPRSKTNILMLYFSEASRTFNP